MYIYCGLLISTIFNLPQLLTRLLFKLDYNRDELALESEILMKSLNAGQMDIYRAILQAIENNQPGFFFIYAYRDTGKTYLWKTIITKLCAQGKIVLPPPLDFSHIVWS